MKLFTIVTEEDPRIHQKCTPVALPLSEETRNTILDMVQYLKLSQDDAFAKKNNIRPGVGIAAPQIGIFERFYAVSFDDEGKHYEYGLVNPEIVSTSVKKGYIAGGEGCLSVPVDVPGHVYRYYKVTIKAFDALTMKDVVIRLHGYPAMVFQHEYDHLDGILYYDRIDPKDPFREDPDAVEL